MTQPIPFVDGHNDFLLRLLQAPERRQEIWLRGDGRGHLDLPRMRRGGFAGGFFAIYVPSPDSGFDLDSVMDAPPYDVPLPPPVALERAQPVALAMAGHLTWMQHAAPEDFRICRSLAEIRACMDAGRIFAIMHMEGAEAIGPDLDALHLFHALGLRSLGPVWSRPNAFGEGVPFAYPATPERGAGLTAAGRDLLSLCNELGVLFDLSHLNAAGFDDVARLSRAPLVATHSNAHAVTPSARNLTDRQLDAIRDSDGMVGLNFAAAFLREDGRNSPDVPLDAILRHLDHLISRLGESRVGFGSDFDGATVPRQIGDVSGLPRLQEGLRAHGYDDALLRRLCHGNWLRVLEATWA